jgi:ribose-phosphate pyrophosphokinase
MSNNEVIKIWKYPGGEIGVRVENPDAYNGIFRLHNAEDLIVMLMTIDAYKNRTKRDVKWITIPYLPYARQDRVATEGDPFAISVIAKLIASAGIDRVHSIDVHSEKGIAAFRDAGVQLVSFSPERYIAKYLKKIGLSTDKVAFIAPDNGASNKTSQYCHMLGVNRAILCQKKRDPDTGKLTGFTVNEEVSATLKGLERDGIKDLIITDDICDGGGTFLGVADAIHAYYGNNFNLHLWTSHGIYSKGLDPLLAKFATLGSTDSFTHYLTNERLHTIPI